MGTANPASCLSSIAQMERRRLKAVAGELERAFEEVRARAAETEEHRLEAETARADALKASKDATTEKELAELRVAQVLLYERSTRLTSGSLCVVLHCRVACSTRLAIAQCAFASQVLVDII